MAKRRPRDLLLPAGLMAGTIALGAGTTALAQGTIAFTSASVSGVLADALAEGPDGSLWSVNRTANTISHVTFPDLHVSTFNASTPNAGLTGITAGPDGNMWFTESAANKIGRIDSSGAITEFPIPSGSSPPQRIFPGPDGTLWATACTSIGLDCRSFIVQNTSGLSSRLVIQTPSSVRFSADRCTLGADGNVWCFGQENFAAFKIARVDKNGGYTAFAPATGVQGDAILAAPDGNVWYTWLRFGTGTGVARVTPSGVITEYAVPMGGEVFGLAVGADGNLYFPDRQTRILYELVLSTATDAGTATINSGTIAVDTPEDLVAVSNQTRAAGIHTQGAPQVSCPAGAAFIARSGGSPFGGIVWVQTEAPSTCTNLRANGYDRRYTPIPGTNRAQARCTDKFDSHDAAFDVVITIQLPPGSRIDNTNVDPTNILSWSNCSIQGSGGLLPLIECIAPSIDPRKYRAIDFTGVFETGEVAVRCTSSTPETDLVDNYFEFETSPAIPQPSNPPVSVEKRK